MPGAFQNEKREPPAKVLQVLQNMRWMLNTRLCGVVLMRENIDISRIPRVVNCNETLQKREMRAFRGRSDKHAAIWITANRENGKNTDYSGGSREKFRRKK